MSPIVKWGIANGYFNIRYHVKLIYALLPHTVEIKLHNVFPVRRLKSSRLNAMERSVSVLPKFLPFSALYFYF